MATLESSNTQDISGSKEAPGCFSGLLKSTKKELARRELAPIVCGLIEIHDNILALGKAAAEGMSHSALEEIFGASDYCAVNYSYESDNILWALAHNGERVTILNYERQKENAIDCFIGSHGGREDVRRDHDDYVIGGTEGRFIGKSPDFGSFIVQSELKMSRGFDKDAFQPFGCHYIPINEAGQRLLSKAVETAAQYLSAGIAHLQEVAPDLAELVCKPELTVHELMAAVEEDPQGILEQIKPFMPLVYAHVKGRGRE